MDSRRDFLKKAALLTGAAGLSNLIPPSIQKAMAINPMPGSTYMDAEHVVILMQENRSFDHMFGTLRGVRGYNDPRAIQLPNQNPVWLQSNNKGETYAPFHLDIKNTKSTWMSSLPHTWADQVAARNDGKFDQWLNVKRSGTKAFADMPLTLGYHNRDDIPFYYALADAFTICDQNFCSALTGTGPNRFFFWTGAIREKPDENSRAEVWNEDADFGTQKWTTFPERLEDAGISWKCYQNEISADVGMTDEENEWLACYTDNPLEYFTQYHSLLYDKHVIFITKQAKELPGHIAEMQKKLDALPMDDPDRPHAKKQLKQKKEDLEDIKKELSAIPPGGFEGLTEREKSIHRKAFTNNSNDPDYLSLTTLSYDDNGTKREVKVPKGDPLYQFRHDVKNGELPTVSWLVAPENFSDHPSAPWYGAWYTSEVIDILTQNPDIWKKTIFILNYDENDGYFDHVPPFTAPHPHKTGTGKASKGIDTSIEYVTRAQELERKGFPEEDERESPIGLGFRVPLIIASPWTRGGFVNSEVFDHTSTLQFLEHFLSKKPGKDIKETNISEWRRTVCGDLTSAFHPYNGENPTWPPVLVKDEVIENIHKAKFKKLPGDYKALSADEVQQAITAPVSASFMPRQETGIKPSCALPYNLYVQGWKTGSQFQINFQAFIPEGGNKTGGAPFTVYAPGKYMGETMRSWNYAVKTGDVIADTWQLDGFEDGNYHLRVYGPNGFYREFAGSKNDPAFGSGCFNQKNAGSSANSGNIYFKLLNVGHKSQTVEIIDNAYKNGNHHITLVPGMPVEHVLDLRGSHNWYDVTVKITGNEQFVRRYAGHVETGKESFTDPYMGRVV